LQPVLGLASAVAIVVGGVIGSGVFLKPEQVAEGASGFFGLILTLWIAIGVVNLCGALALAELSAMMPHAGGSYVFLREAYGRPWGFAWAWAEFWVIRSGSTATLAAAMTVSLRQLAATNGIDLATWTQRSIAIGTIVGLASINIVGTRWGGAVQNLTTVIKGAFVVFLACLPFFAIGSEPVGSEVRGRRSATGMQAARLWALWPTTFDRCPTWPKVHEPQRNVPLRSLPALSSDCALCRRDVAYRDVGSRQIMDMDGMRRRSPRPSSCPASASG
jgi:APA family basic amino acid/polyamine antiporter